MTLELKTAAQWMKADLKGRDCLFTGVSHDTRTLKKGDLFVAIEGKTVDGHAYISEAESKGAIGVLVSKAVKTKLPTLTVSNTIEALGLLAKHYRHQWQIPMAAITGSCGKTTVKEMLSCILSSSAPYLANMGNLNTDIGLPLTLLRLQPEHRYAVIEMGARKKGDIRYLMQIANPTVSLITNVGPAHIEIFGSELGIAEAKGEIYQSLRQDGIAILNEDDKYAKLWRGFIQDRQMLSFGLESKADITACNLQSLEKTSNFELITPKGQISIHLPLPGRHSIYNALAAASLALGLGLTLEAIQEGLQRFQPVNGRMQFKPGLKGALIIDDSYNANPLSMKAALKVLSEMPGQKIFVMGDMFELGENARNLHEEIGSLARQLKIDRLYGIGQNTEYATLAFGLSGRHFQEKAALIADLKPAIEAQTTVLIKGSRGMRMEEVVYSVTESAREKTVC